MNAMRWLALLLVVGVAAGAIYLFQTDPQDGDTGPATPQTKPLEERRETPAEAAPTVATKTDEATLERAAAEVAKTDATDPAKPKASQARCEVVGRVLNDAGQPLSGVPVALNTLGGMMIIDSDGESEAPNRKATKTGADGKFKLYDVRGGFGISVRAEPADFAIAEKSIPDQDGGTIDLGDFVCPTGGTLTGRVLDDTGNPIAGAQVDAWTVEKGASGGAGLFVFGDGGQSKARRTKTDGSGQFRITGIAPGSVAMVASAEGHTREFKSEIEVKRGQITPEVVLSLSRGQAIEGVVVDAGGSAIVGATVQIMERIIDLSQGGIAQQMERSREAQSDANGRFRITGLREVPYNLNVSATNFLTMREQDVAVGRNDVRITLRPSGVVYGYVKNKVTNQPLANFEVRAEFDPNGTPLFVDFSRTTPLYGDKAKALAGVADANGLFAITNLPAESCTIQIHADGFAPVALSSVDVKSGTKAQHDVELMPEIRISGIVLDTRQQPVEGATVRLGKKTGDDPEAVGTTGFRRIVRSVRARPAASPTSSDSTFDFDGELPTAITDADGRFTLRGLKAGEYALKAQHSLWAPSESLSLSLNDGDDRDDIELVMAEAGVLTGKTFDANGQPVSGITVKLAAKRTAGGDGMDLGGLGMAIGGGGGSAPLRDVSKSDGTYEITGIPPGDYFAELERPRTGGFGSIYFAMDTDAPQKGTPVTIEAGQKTLQDLALSPTGRIRGRVTESGNPVANVSVGIQKTESPFPMDIASAKTDADGNYELLDVEPGDYEVIATPVGAPVPIKKKVDVAGRQTAEINLSLPTGGISGTVKDKDSHEPLENVLVEVRKHEPAQPSNAPVAARRAVSMVMVGGLAGGTQTFSIGSDSKEIRTDAEGRYTIRYLEPGDYDVSIHGGGVTEIRKESVKVEAQKTTERIDFDAERGAVLDIQVKANDDEPLLFVSAHVEGIDDPTFERREFGQGSKVTIDGLKAGRYRVTIDSDDRTGTQEVTLSSGEKKPLEIEVN